MKSLINLSFYLLFDLISNLHSYLIIIEIILLEERSQLKLRMKKHLQNVLIPREMKLQLERKLNNRDQIQTLQM